MDEQKKQALKVALGQIEKQFGKGSVMFLGKEESRTDIEAYLLFTSDAADEEDSVDLGGRRCI